MVLPGCGLREKEKELERRSGELNRREQEVSLKEKYLQVKELELSEKQKRLDSNLTKIQADTLAVMNPQLPGIWNVNMNCIQTTCSGSAVGDIKTEQWDISYADNTIVARAMSGNDLVRVYTGNFNGTTLELTARSEEMEPQQTARMQVRLVQTKENEMEGQREILRGDACKIIYALQMKKK